MNTNETISPIECTIDNAPRFLSWCQTRGGVARWRSINLSDPCASWSTPALQPDGSPTLKPTWQADNQPELIESDTNKIMVYTDREVKRFHVALRMGSQGLSLKCTNASAARIRREVEKAGEGAYRVFDYDTQEAVIMQPAGKQTLAQWAAANVKPEAAR